MRSAQQRPNFGLFDQKPVAGEPAEFTIDTAAGLLLRASPGGCQLWGLDPATAALPLAIDSAMPALQRLRDLALRKCIDPTRREMLTFWTARGVVQLACRVEVGAVAEIITINALADEPVVPPQGSGLLNGHTPGHGEPQPEVAPEAWLAHELRTPLSAVIAYAEILKDEHFGPLANPRYKGYARDIYDSARHALGVVDSLLRGEACRSVVPPLAFAELDPVRVVESCLTVARPLAARASLVLGADYAAHLPHIVADELTLKQMLLNLLTNAIKFARPGDRVTIGVAHAGAGGLSISVADTGPGMAPATVGAPCATSQPAHVPRHEAADLGLGLGLPLTRALAAANGATLVIDSEPGQGTRATLSFGQDRIVVH